MINRFAHEVLRIVDVPTVRSGGAGKSTWSSQSVTSKHALASVEDAAFSPLIAR
jgi:hypothetical protein